MIHETLKPTTPRKKKTLIWQKIVQNDFLKNLGQHNFFITRNVNQLQSNYNARRGGLWTVKYAGTQSF